MTDKVRKVLGLPAICWVLGRRRPWGKQEVMQRARATYDGPLVMGEDLTVIRVGKDEVVAEPWRG